MKVWAIGDLHLPGGDMKPMDVFGEHWRNHFDKICKDWSEKVQPEDVVLIPGDISWAMNLPEALTDLKNIASLPGRMIILKGNHDYWWTSLTQLRASLPPNMSAIQNDALQIDDVLFAGTRGWTIPPESSGSGTSDPGTSNDKQMRKIYLREGQRLRFSLERARSISKDAPIIAMMHYPPVTGETLSGGTIFTRTLREFDVAVCVYGHLHGGSIAGAVTGIYDHVHYELVSCDALNFTLKEIPI